MYERRPADVAAEWRLSVAPMMDRTDRFFRYLMRLISPSARLYTEMLTAQAVVYGDRHRLLAFDAIEHPVAAQLGGSDPSLLAAAASLCAAAGYDEVNLNCGCPSDRVQSGRFGACLLAEPEQVAACIRAMKEAVDVPVTVKTRVALDGAEPRDMLWPFIETVAAAGCETFIVHARAAWLQGLSPKENREIPPLRYEVVHALKQDFPALRFILNGGMRDVDDVRAQLDVCDGVMIGRAAYTDPWLLTRLESAPGSVPPAGRAAVVEQFLPFARREITAGVPPRAIVRHLIGLYHGQPGAKTWRRLLSEGLTHLGARTFTDRAALAARTVELIRASVPETEYRQAVPARVVSA